MNLDKGDLNENLIGLDLVKGKVVIYELTCRRNENCINLHDV